MTRWWAGLNKGQKGCLEIIHPVTKILECWG